MRLWVTAGGTGSAWHICQTAKKYFADEIELYVSDTNPPTLVPASTLADHFFVVPPVKAEGYREYMLALLEEHKIDVLIPLIPWEQPFFSPEAPELKALGVVSLAPLEATSRLLNHKEALYHFCQQYGIPTIATYGLEDYKKNTLDKTATYFLKAKDGFGAMGACTKIGEELCEEDFEACVVQEYCGEGKEVTVEAFAFENSFYGIVRRRLEAKSGVCTKAEFLKEPALLEQVQKITTLVDMPRMFNIQFIEDQGQWKLMDVNLRLAAGTGLSCAAGFQLVRAALASLLGKEVSPDWLQCQEGIRTVLRVYEEIVIREETTQ